MSESAIWWVRRDLRLSDNEALTAVTRRAQNHIPLFIVDPFFDTSPYVGQKRRDFLWAGLRALDADLRQRGSRLIVRYGEPDSVLRAVMAESGATAVYAQADYSTYARKRDGRLTQSLPLHLVGSPAMRPPGAVTKADGTPYTVFTPFSRVWKQAALPQEDELLPAPMSLQTPASLVSSPLPGGHNQFAAPGFPAGEAEAKRRLALFVTQKIHNYAQDRDIVDLAGTSTLSPYLRWGMLSARQAAAAITARDLSQNEGASTWLNELIWRDFYWHILFHFPHVLQRSFRPKYEHIPWRNDPDQFAAWRNGRTGYPIVDAAMRQLLQTGWMHNRARMITASFLVKDLLIDWRWGERWFMQHLLDGDPAANNGGWQWSAGTGTDAAPYFRIFNPITQSKKFAGNGRCLRRWLPELAHIPGKYIHTPWKMPLSEQKHIDFRIGTDYPEPIVDHKVARLRTLEAYKLSNAQDE